MKAFLSHVWAQFQGKSGSTVPLPPPSLPPSTPPQQNHIYKGTSATGKLLYGVIEAKLQYKNIEMKILRLYSTLYCEDGTHSTPSVQRVTSTRGKKDSFTTV